MELQELLEDHAHLASKVAERAADAELELLAFALDQSCPDPSSALAVVAQLEKVRSSAVADLRRTIGALRGPRQDRPPVQVAVVNATTARVVDEASPGPCTRL